MTRAGIWADSEFPARLSVRAIFRFLGLIEAHDGIKKIGIIESVAPSFLGKIAEYFNIN